jgi:ribose/xylose/arabinose/galactoside ABC-type transport system permease subunit
MTAKSLLHLASSSRLLVIMAVILLFMAACEPSFFSAANLLNILSNASINGILAVGMTALMISCAFDISIGSIVVLAGVLSVMTVDRSNPALAVAVGVGSGVLMGLVNGVLVAKWKVNSFIATLGTSVVFQGIAFALTDTGTIATDSESFHQLATGGVAGIPATILYFLAVTLAVWAFLRFTKPGKYAYAIGGNEAACRMLGLHVDRYRILFFLISGVCASFAGVLLASKVNAASGVFAENKALVVIAAIVLGGVHLAGGAGTVGGVVQGVILLALLENVTVYLRVVGYYETFFRSLILIGVVVFDVVHMKWLNLRLERQGLFQLQRANSLQ